MKMFFACPFSSTHFAILNKVGATNRLLSYHFIRQQKGDHTWVGHYVQHGQLPQKPKKEK